MTSPMQTRGAGSREVGEFNPVQLFAGEYPTSTEPGTAGAALLEYQVVALLNGAYVPHDPTAVDSKKDAAGIALFAVNGTTQTKVEVYTGGFFNHEALVWHASLTTLAQRKAVFSRLGTIKIGNLVNF